MRHFTCAGVPFYTRVGQRLGYGLTKLATTVGLAVIALAVGGCGVSPTTDVMVTGSSESGASNSLESGGSNEGWVAPRYIDGRVPVPEGSSGRQLEMAAAVALDGASTASPVIPIDDRYLLYGSYETLVADPDAPLSDAGIGPGDVMGTVALRLQ